MTQDVPVNQAYLRGSRLRRGLGWLRDGRPDLALPVFRILHENEPGDPVVTLALATALLRNADPSAALETFDSLLSDHPEHTGALQGRGLCLHVSGDIPAALDAFRRAVAIDPLAWRSWQSIADITPHEDERVHAIEGAADALSVLCQAGTAPAPQLADLTSALIEARLPGKVARILETPTLSASSDSRLIRARARALYHAGDHRSAFLEAARLWRTVRERPPADTARQTFQPEEAKNVLTDLRGLLSAAGVESFLIAGTLLGFHRDGGPLAHDRDIDIGVFRTPEGGPDIAGIFRAAPRILLPRIARPGDRYFGLMHKGVAVDIFVHERSGPHILTGVSHMHGDIQWRFSEFGLRSASYGGQVWTVPSDPARYLTETYGPGWQTPDTSFASAVSSPALCGVSLHARGYYAIMRAIRAFTSGDTAKAAALIAGSPVPLPPEFLQPTD
jgi:hypothetical protein